MKIKTFNDIVQGQLEHCTRLLTGKGHEYAEGAEADEQIDRLAHFKKAAALQDETPEQAAFGMLAKHLVSISDMVSSGEMYSLSQWNEKITDSINYLLIIRAIVEENAAVKAKEGVAVA